MFAESLHHTPWTELLSKSLPDTVKHIKPYYIAKTAKYDKHYRIPDNDRIVIVVDQTVWSDDIYTGVTERRNGCKNRYPNSPSNAELFDEYSHINECTEAFNDKGSLKHS